MPPPVLQMKIQGKTVSLNSKADLKQLHGNLEALRDLDLLVGFPDGTTDRTSTTAQAPMTNAALAYIHDNGEPSANIPARPFMVPGIEAAMPKIQNALTSALRAALNIADPNVAMRRLDQAGAAAVSGIKLRINEGIPPPLATSTLLKRQGHKKGVQIELQIRAAGLLPTTGNVVPLVDTAQMRNAVTYVLRSKKARP